MIRLPVRECSLTSRLSLLVDAIDASAMWKNLSTDAPVSSTDEGEFGGSLQAATISGNLEVVRLLLDHGVDVNTQGGRFGTAVAAAITLENHEMIRLLVEYGVDISHQAPGSPLLAPGRNHVWTGHRNPFSRSRQPRKWLEPYSKRRIRTRWGCSHEL